MFSISHYKTERFSNNGPNAATAADAAATAAVGRLQAPPGICLPLFQLSIRQIKFKYEIKRRVFRRGNILLPLPLGTYNGFGVLY